MTNAAVQKEAFPLASRLTIVYSLTLAKPSIHLAKSSAEWLSKTVIGNLTKPDIGSADLRVSNPDAQTTPINSGLLNPLENLLLSPPSLRREILNLRGTKRLAQNPLRVVQNLTSKFSTFTNSTRTRAEGFSNITRRAGLYATVRACARGREGFSVITTRCGEFSESIKKGNALPKIEFCEPIKKGLICDTAPIEFEGVSQSELASVLGVRRWRRLISPLAAAIKKPAVLSPSSFSFSISSKSSKGSLTETCSERLFFLPVAITDAPIFRWCSVYTGKLFVKALRWCSPCYTLVVFTLSTGKEQVIHKIAKPGSASTLTGHLTKPLYEVTIMADSQSTQTRPKFQYRFLAIDRANRKATPCRLSVEAYTEQEARLILCAHFILSLAARLPAQEVSRA